jgi:hypothetical protein
MVKTTTLAFCLLVAGLGCPIFASGQEGVIDVLTGFSLLGNPSVIGSNGVLYIIAGSTKSPKLEAYNLDATVKGPVDTYKFSGYPTQLEIGKDNRLYLVVSETSSVLSAPALSAPTPNFVVFQTKTKLFIIPTPFPVRAQGATLESTAMEANDLPSGDSHQALTAVVQVALEGTLRSLKVKAVGDKEYLYVITNQLQLSPLKFYSKLHIYDSDGKKIKDAAIE